MGITTAPEIGGVVEGWEPLAWRNVLAQLVRSWRGPTPVLPRPGDPPAFPARPLGPGAPVAARG